MKEEKEEKEKVIQEVAIQEEYEMSAIFSDDLSESVAEEIVGGGGADPNIYSISLKNENVVNGVYKSVGRFVKNPRVKKGEKPVNIIHKWQYFLPDPDNPESKLVVDCTSNFGQRHNIITKAFFYLRNTKNPSLMQLGKEHFSRKGYYYSLLQIVKDVQQPELVGKVKVLRFATQINEKLEDITKTDEDTNQVGVNYSHPLTGRNFIFNLQEEEFEDKASGKKKKMPSYNKSKFEDKDSALLIPNSDVPAGNTKEYQQALFSYLLKEAPNLEEYKPTEWTPEVEEKIIEAVRMVIEDDNIFNVIYRKTYGKSYVFDRNDVRHGSGSEKKGLQIQEETLLEEKEEILINTPNSPASQTGYSEEDDLPEDLEA